MSRDDINTIAGTYTVVFIILAGWALVKDKQGLMAWLLVPTVPLLIAFLIYADSVTCESHESYPTDKSCPIGHGEVQP